MSDIFHFLAERAIEEALQKNAFDNLSGNGKPMAEPKGSAMNDYMQKMGCVPREVMLRKKLEQLQQDGAPLAERQEIELEIQILAEQRRSQTKF
jgi:hypothetical protein